MGLIMKVDRARNEASVRFGNFTATLTAPIWAGVNATARRVQERSLAEFEIKEVDEKNRRLKVELSQVPAVQGAMMTLNAKTGEIVTMVGGYDFYTNKFNNAIQAYRQTGSCFQTVHLHGRGRVGMTPDTPSAARRSASATGSHTTTTARW
jgi:penicillin-binding protein 1A